MCIRKVLSRSFPVAVALTFSGVAFAHQPPSLTKMQEAGRLAACEKGGETSGYRNAFVRIAPAHASMVSDARSYEASGYRGAPARFGYRTVRETACVTPIDLPRFSASR